jgi:long-chain acyl-CoA synthetase
VPDSVPVQQEIGNLVQLVTRAARESPDHVALRWEAGALTWAQLSDQVAAVAAGLRRLDLAPGDRVALALSNCPEFVAGYFGAIAADLVAVPLNPTYTGTELHRLLADSGARVLLAAGEALDALNDPALPLSYRYAVGAPHPSARPYAELATPTTNAELSPSRSGEQLAALLYTSGTSGRPRGVMLSHRALLANSEQLARLDPPPLGPDDVVLLTLPLFHAFGLGPGLHSVAWHGATSVLAAHFDPAATLELIADQGVTCVLGVPAMYLAWCGQPNFAERFASVRLAVCGAAPLPVGTRRALADAGVSAFFEGYGLTETAPVVTSTLASRRPKPASVGRPIPGVALKLLGPDGMPLSPEDSEEDANASPGTDPGEIWVRGDNLFSGYWPDGVGGPDPDGWWATGDIGYQDEDGDLYLVDRIDELILVSGFNVYPREVEDVLAGYPGVREAAAVGVPHPVTGEAVKGYVVIEPDAAVSEADLLAHCRRYLATFKCPVAVETVSHVPHSATGKVRKSFLARGD